MISRRGPSTSPRGEQGSSVGGVWASAMEAVTGGGSGGPGLPTWSDGSSDRIHGINRFTSLSPMQIKRVGMVTGGCIVGLLFLRLLFSFSAPAQGDEPVVQQSGSVMPYLFMVWILSAGALWYTHQLAEYVKRQGERWGGRPAGATPHPQRSTGPTSARQA